MLKFKTIEGSPLGVIEPDNIGEVYFDTVNNEFWISTDLDDQSWKKLT